MPIYEFHCKECQHDFRTLSRAEKQNEAACPNCGTTRVSRLLSVTAQVAASPSQGEACARPQAMGCMGNPSACGCRFPQ